MALNLTLDRATVKKEIIQNTIYGVDVEKGAVDIARLRFWLALVVDEDEPQPLPNLDYKIMQGNSLFESFESIDLQFEPKRFEVKIIKEVDLFGKPINPQISITEYLQSKEQLKEFSLKDLEDKYFNSNNAQEKQEIKRKIDAFEKEFIEEQVQKREGELKTLIKSKKDSGESKKHKEYLQHEEELTELKEVKKLLNELRADNKPYFLWHLYFMDVFMEGGFDIVIGNPPYLQISKLKDGALANAGFKTFEKNGDLYCLFYEMGISMLREKGVLAYITSNSWLQTQYGKSLRKYLIENTNPLILLNFTDIQLFETAVVETNILIARKSLFQKQLKVAVLDDRYQDREAITEFVGLHGYKISELSSDGWTIGDEKGSALKRKMEVKGKILKDWSIRIDYGIKTGLNEAFIISGETKNELIKADPKNSEIIKPTLRGRDLRRYSYKFSDQWIICTFPGKKVIIDDYPVLKKYFLEFGKHRLEQSGNPGSRKKTGNAWYETQDQIAYWKLFEEPKIIWGELSDQAKFTFDDEAYYVEATTFFLTGESLKYLLAVFNSKAAQWYFEKISTTSGMGTNRWKKYKIEQLPVPVPDSKKQEIIEQLVNQVLNMKGNNTDTTKWENKIDALVFQLYELDESEMLQILGSFKELSIKDKTQINNEYRNIQFNKFKVEA